MKFFKGSALLVSMGLLFGTASAVGGTIEVKAADQTIMEGFRTEYVHIPDNVYNEWTSGGTKELRSYWWNSTVTGVGSEKYYPLGSEIGNTDVYPFYVPNDETTFLLYNGSWNTTNQTVNVLLSDLETAAERVAAIDSMGITFSDDSRIIYEVSGGIDTGSGKYSVSLTTKRDYQVSSEFARYWLDRGGREFNHFWFLAFNLGTEADPEWKAIQAADYPPTKTPTGEEGDNTKYLAYFDVPVSYIGRTYIAFSLNTYFWQSDIDDDTTDPTILLDTDFSKVHKISWPMGNPTMLDYDGVYAELDANSVSAEFIANYVLPAYYTCLPSEANGYLAASELIDTWMSNDRLIGGMDALADVTLQDYAYAGPDANYDDYYTTADRTSTTTALDKLNTMEILEASHTGANAGYMATFVSDPSSIATITAGTLVLVSILGFSVFYFVRRRKHASN